MRSYVEDSNLIKLKMPSPIAISVTLVTERKLCITQKEGSFDHGVVTVGNEFNSILIN